MADRSSNAGCLAGGGAICGPGIIGARVVFAQRAGALLFAQRAGALRVFRLGVPPGHPLAGVRGL